MAGICGRELVRAISRSCSRVLQASLLPWGGVGAVRSGAGVDDGTRELAECVCEDVQGSLEESWCCHHTVSNHRQLVGVAVPCARSVGALQWNRHSSRL